MRQRFPSVAAHERRIISGAAAVIVRCARRGNLFVSQEGFRSALVGDCCGCCASSYCPASGQEGRSRRSPCHCEPRGARRGNLLVSRPDHVDGLHPAVAGIAARLRTTMSHGKKAWFRRSYVTARRAERAVVMLFASQEGMRSALVRDCCGCSRATLLLVAAREGLYQREKHCHVSASHANAVSARRMWRERAEERLLGQHLARAERW